MGLTLGQEDPMEKRMATDSNILAWEIPWTEEPGGLNPWGHKVRHDLVTKYTCMASYKNLATYLKHDLAHKAVVRTEWVNTCKLLQIVSDTE